MLGILIGAVAAAAAATAGYGTRDNDDAAQRCPPDDCVLLICLYGRAVDDNGCVACDCLSPCQASLQYKILTMTTYE